ncbi:MAG: hypothetical protein WCW84_13195 [Sulfurimonas sp.]
MLERFKQKFLLWLHSRIESMLDIEKKETGITADEAMEIFDNRISEKEANFDEKMIAVIEIMMETKLEIFSKVNDLVITNESWIANHHCKDQSKKGDIQNGQ